MPGVAPVQSTSGGDWWNPLDWFKGLFQKATDWLGGLGGDIASGVEGGTIAILKDILGALLPWLEIAAGAFIAFWAISFYFATSPAGQSVIRLLAMGVK